jgi:hypothetical protein
MELIWQVGRPFFHTHLRRVGGGGQFTPLASRFYRWRGARVRLTGDRSVVVRTFQLEDGVLRERERGREGEIDGWKRISELDRRCRKGRKELKMEDGEIQWCDSIGWGRHGYGLARAWSTQPGKTRVGLA